MLKRAFHSVYFNNRCLANCATVVCRKEELCTHWISLYLSYSHICRGRDPLAVMHYTEVSSIWRCDGVIF